MKASEMTNEELTKELTSRVPLDSNRHDDIREAVREVAQEMLNTSMQDITAERINGWATRLAACEQPVTDCNQMGNAAKMREALQEARRFVSASAHRTDRDLLVMDDDKRGAYVLTPKETLIKIDAALSAPPRNCDIMDWRTAWAKWRTECHPQKPCGYAEVVSGTEQFMDWYMSEAKGETK